MWRRFFVIYETSNNFLSLSLFKLRMSLWKRRMMHIGKFFILSEGIKRNRVSKKSISCHRAKLSLTLDWKNRMWYCAIKLMNSLAVHLVKEWTSKWSLLFYFKEHNRFFWFLWDSKREDFNHFGKSWGKGGSLNQWWTTFYGSLHTNFSDFHLV